MATASWITRRLCHPAGAAAAAVLAAVSVSAVAAVAAAATVAAAAAVAVAEELMAELPLTRPEPPPCTQPRRQQPQRRPLP